MTIGERGVVAEPVTLPVLREGIDELERLIAASGVIAPPVIGLEATGRCIVRRREIERRRRGSLRLFAPSEISPRRGQ